MSTNNDSERAYPGQMATGYDARSGNFNEGMSLRQYFAARAPAPPEWFEPSDLPPKPESPAAIHNRLSDEIRKQAANPDMRGRTNPEMAVERLRKAYEAAEQSLAMWQLQHDAACYSQWPWADAVLAAEKGGAS